MLKHPRWTITVAGVLMLSGCTNMCDTPSMNICGDPSLIPTAEDVDGNNAPTITNINAIDTGKGTQVIIKATEAVNYKVFPLDNPPRILLAFPGLKLDPTVQPRKVELATISSIYPMETPDGATRLEITLKDSLKYDFVEIENGLEVNVSSQEVIDAKAGPTLRDLQIKQDENGTKITILGTGELPTPQAFRLNDPPRLVVDLPGLTSALDSKLFKVNSPELASVEMGKDKDKVRLVANLMVNEVTFIVEKDGDFPVIHLGKGTNSSQKTPELLDVDFTRDGEAAVIKMKLNRSDVIVTSQLEGQDLIVDLKGVKIPKELTQRMDVSAFGGPIKTVDSYNEHDHARIVVGLNASAAQHKLVQNGDDVLVTVIPDYAIKKEDDKAVYKGEKISMDFKDIDIQNALSQVATELGMNIIISDTVKGKLTMQLIDVPLDQVLDLILETRGLGKVQEGNILRIAPLGEITALSTNKQQALTTNQGLEPLEMEMISINFANSEEIKTLLMEGDAKLGTRLLSGRGAVSVDKRTNTLIIQDTAGNIGRVRQMVKSLDTPIPQVLIEARIVEVDWAFTKSLGINWGLVGFSTDEKNGGSHWTTGNHEGYMGGGIVSAPPRYPAYGLARFNMGLVSPLVDLDVELRAMESVGKSKTISSPRVLTMNNNKATISQGIAQAYLTESSSGGTTYEWQTAALQLDVTPQVTSDGHITLDVQATNDALGVSLPGAPSPINTKDVKTQVLVKNGDTIVLGGIFQNKNEDTTQSIPGFGDIPFLGNLFQTKQTKKSQVELLIFLTPRIVGIS